MFADSQGFYERDIIMLHDYDVISFICYDPIDFIYYNTDCECNMYEWYDYCMILRCYVKSL